MILAYVPDLDYSKVIPHYNQRWKEKYLWTIHSICFQQLRNKSAFNGYANINLALLQKYIGSKYSNYVLTQLLNAKIIEPYVNSKGVQSYVAGAFSKAYRINPEIMANVRIKATPIKKKTYIRKITNVRTELIREAVKLNPHLQHELLNLTFRRIRYKEAMDYINTNYVEGSAQYSARKIAIKEFNELHKLDLSQGKEVLTFHFSYNKGRVYSPASMLPRDLEQFTYFEGYEKERSICLDMPNSQLCFFDELVKRSVFKDENAYNVEGVNDIEDSEEEKVHKIGRKDREKKEGEREDPTNQENIPSPPYPSLCYEFLNGQNDWKTYIRKGYGYEIMMKHFNWKDKDSNHTKEERQEFKEIFFGQLFYNRYIPNYLTPLEKVFKEHFPVEAENLLSIKRKLTNKGLAVQVQTLEGKFFHDIIVNYLKTNYKNVPFTIKHDSVTLPESEASYLIEELNQLVRNFFNDSEMSFKVEAL
jgi:hypothetical protein